MSKTMRYCNDCSLLYEYQSAPHCQQCGSHSSSTFTTDYRREDLTRFYVNRSIKEYTKGKES